jgi:hypothetical protein
MTQWKKVLVRILVHTIRKAHVVWERESTCWTIYLYFVLSQWAGHVTCMWETNILSRDWVTVSQVKKKKLIAPTVDSSTNCPAYNIVAQTSHKTPFLCCCFQLLPPKHACLQSHYSVMADVYLLISQLLPSNGSYTAIYKIWLGNLFKVYKGCGRGEGWHESGL